MQQHTRSMHLSTGETDYRLASLPIPTHTGADQTAANKQERGGFGRSAGLKHRRPRFHPDSTRQTEVIDHGDNEWLVALARCLNQTLAARDSVRCALVPIVPMKNGPPFRGQVKYSMR
jgi:hypothetical protein